MSEAPHQLSFADQKLQILAHHLSPENPIRSTEFLRGRTPDLQNIEQELRFFRAIPFIFGNRGVGKTSLARTAAQQVTPSDREHIYVACAPESRMLSILKEIALQLLKLAIKYCNATELSRKLEVNISLNPGIKLTIERRSPQLADFDTVNTAVRTLKEIDELIPDAKQTVVIIDELEELNAQDRRDLAFLVKQAGDQEFGIRFVLIGIAENVHELIGAHESVARYIKEVSLAPLIPQVLMDIVKDAATEIGVTIDPEILIRIAIIGNGYPHFAHLMGKTILTEAALAGASEVTSEIYKSGVVRAISESIQQLRMSYESATQRRDDIYKHLIWALGDSDIVDLRIDDWTREYRELAARQRWGVEEDSRISYAMTRLNQPEFGRIVTNTPIRYGSRDMRYRYKRFSNNLMKGHVRLQAENEGIQLGAAIHL